MICGRKCHHDKAQLRRISISRDHSAGRLAVCSVHPQFPRCGGPVGDAGSWFTYETVHRWVRHFGPEIAANLRQCQAKPHSTWHLTRCLSKSMADWSTCGLRSMPRAEVLVVLVQSKRDKRAALKLMRKLLKKMVSPLKSSKHRQRLEISFGRPYHGGHDRDLVHLRFRSFLPPS